MPEVAIRLLGGFAARVDQRPVPDRTWRLRKARDLVKLLALAPGRRLHREQAMEALWPGRDLVSAANNLHQVVHFARRALGTGALLVHEDLLELDASVAVDVDAFTAAAAAARRSRTPAALRAALAAYGGELLPENRYDDWAAARRDELGWIHAELADELAALGPEAGRRGLPAETSSFVGRDHELVELRALLDRTRLLTLAGPGGAGKTRLALELARASEEAYRDGATLVELAAVGDPGGVTDAVAAALDVRALPGGSTADTVADLLAPRSSLLVLDNCEHVLDACALLAEALLRAAPGLTVMTTSREPLHVRGEVVFRVPSLAVPDPNRTLPPAELLRYEAVRLLVERAASVAPGFTLDDGNAAAIARICYRLDGLPLALELAAARLDALTPADVAARLDDRFRLLRAGDHRAPTRHATLAAALQWSHDLLDPAEAAVLRRLAVFVGGFELDAAEEVCGGDGIDPATVADLLARLVEQSLVAVEDHDGRRRYRLLETIRAFARGPLAAAGETSAVARRHARWAVGLARREARSPRLDAEAANLRAALDTLLESDAEEALRLCAALWPFWLRRIELEEAQRRFAAALERVPARTPLRAAALLAAARFDFRAGTLASADRQVRESLGIARELGDRRAEWRALELLGDLAVAADDADTARRRLRTATALAHREGLPAAEALGTYALGVVAWIAGDLAAADRLTARSLAAFRALAGSSERVPSLPNVAESRMGPGGAGPRLRLVFEETLQPFVEIGCRAAAGYVLANRANLARAAGDLPRARTLLDEALATFAADEDERGRADVLARQAYVELASGAPEAAERRFRAALAARRALNDRRGIGLVLAGLGQTATLLGDDRAAERQLAESREIFRRAGDRWGLASALWRTADLALARGRPGEARAALDEALAALETTGRSRWIAFTLCGLAEAAAMEGDGERASDLLAGARERFAARGEEDAVAAVDERLAALAKAVPTACKGASRTTAPGRRDPAAPTTTKETQ